MDDLNLELCTLVQAVTVSNTPIDKAVNDYLKVNKELLEQ